jgi:hypothetical protein
MMKVKLIKYLSYTDHAHFNHTTALKKKKMAAIRVTLNIKAAVSETNRISVSHELY